VVPFLLVSAVVPSMLLIWFFHSRDVYPEPQRVVWATFGLGVLTVIPVIVIELIISAGIKHVSNPFVNGTLEGFFCAGFTEELFKYLVVTLYCMRHKEFDEPMDGIVYGAVASLGFATLENVLYVTDGGGGAAVMRALSAVPGHACMGAVMGYFVGQAKFTPQKRVRLMVLGFVIPMLLHGAYDAPLLTAARFSANGPIPDGSAPFVGLFLLVTLATLIGEIVWTLVLSGKLRREQQVWHSARWAAWYAGQPPPPPPWFQGFVAQPVWTYAAQPQRAAPQAPGFGQGQPQGFGQGQPQGFGQGQPQGFGQGQPQGFGQAKPAGVSSSPGGAILSWLLLVSGGMIATFGGLMGLGALLAAATPQSAQTSGSTSAGVFVLVGLIFGFLPLMLGAGLFFYGMKRLVAVEPPPPPRVYPVYA
jgi:hypothetical protein